MLNSTNTNPLIINQRFTTYPYYCNENYNCLKLDDQCKMRRFLKLSSLKELEIVQVTAVVNLEGGKIITVQKAKKDSEKSTKVVFILKVMLWINPLLLLMMMVMHYERYVECI